MFTTIDKALTAAIMGILSILAIAFGIHISWLTPEVIASIVAAITPLLVYLIPNKTAPPAS